MKTIPEIQFKDAGDLTPLQMNAIHFDTGDRSQYVGDNMFYNINSIVQVGVEYDYGRRVNYDGRQAHDNRLQAMLQVSF